MWRHVLAMFCAVLTAGIACQPPRTPVGELTRFNPPRIQVVRPPRVSATPGALVLAAPLTQGVEIVPRVGHAADVVSTAMSPDGQVAVSASRDRTVKVWDLRSGALLRNLAVGEQVATSVAVAPDGRRAVTAGPAGKILVWALPTGQLLRTLQGHARAVTGLAMSPDGKRVATSSANHELAVWNLETGMREVAAETSGVIGAVAFSWDGSEVLAGDGEGSLLRYSAGTLELLRSIPGHAQEVTAVATSSDGRRVLSASADGRVKLWDVTSGALLLVLAAHARPVRGVSVSGDAARAVSVSDDGTVKVWDLEKKRGLGTMRGHRGAVRALSTAGQLQVALTGGVDGTLRVWDLQAREPLSIIEARENAAAFVTMSESGRSALAVSEAGDMRLWDLASLAVSKAWRDEAAPITAAALAPDASRALTASTDVHGAVSLNVWDVGAGRIMQAFDAGPDTVTSAAFLPHASRAVTGGMLGSVRLWGIAINKPLRELVGHTSPVRDIRVTSDGLRALTSSVAPMVGPDRVKLWDLDTGAEVLGFDGFGVGALSDDGRRAVLGDRNGTLALWDLEVSSETTRWTAHGSRVVSVAIAPRGKLAASGAADGTLRVWELPKGLLSQSLGGHRGAVTRLAWSADGKRLLSASEDGTMRLWRLETGASAVLVAGGDDWLVYADDGYFAASSRGTDLAFAVSGMRGFRLDQLAARHNRPDLLLERVGTGSAELLRDFAARHRRRLRALGATQQQLRSTFGSAPQVVISKLEQRGRDATVTFEVGVDEGKARYQLLVNGVPWLQAPKPVQPGEITESFQLVTGRNKVAIEVFDDAGARAIPASHVLRHSGAGGPGVLHYLGIGVSKYRHQGLGLKYADKDAVELGRYFERASRRQFRDVRVHTLINEEATRKRIAGAREQLEGAAVDDTVVLFVAGHWAHTRGVPADSVFIPHDGDPGQLGRTTTPWASVVSLLAGIPARRRLVILDGCVSGDRNDSELRGALGEASRRGLIPRTSAALLPPHDVPPRAFLFQDHHLMMDDVAAESGAVILRASRGAELCYELDDLKSGALTAALLRALSTPEADSDSDGRVSLDELRAFVGPAVANMTGGLQHPTFQRGNVEQEVLLPRVSDVPLPSVKIEHPLAGKPPPGCTCHAGPASRGDWLWALAGLCIGWSLCSARKQGR